MLMVEIQTSTCEVHGPVRLPRGEYLNGLYVPEGSTLVIPGDDFEEPEE